MAEAIGPIASAVIVPDQVPDASKSFVAGTKRRFSIETESEAKRPKVDENLKAELKEGSPTSRRSSIKSEIDPLEEKKNTNPERRKSSVQEERKRGQRLFGGLLSTLSQSTPNGQQKRRQEIEKRQQEKAKQQKAEDEGRRTQKLADLKAVRKAEQIKFDGKSMRIRHTNMLAMAQSLTTNIEPKLYYKPWELLPLEEERIKEQIARTESLIEREVEEFDARYPKAPEKESSVGEKANITSKETVGEPHTESPSVSKAVDTTNDSPVQVTQSEQVTAEKQSLEEHSGEVVVENEEDTVIY